MTTIQATRPSPGAAEAYDRLAPAYDVLTAAYCHEPWLAAIERLARAHGLRGRRLLDVACGTGKSFLPMAARGYEVTACDVSPRMVAIARAKAPQVKVSNEDMRDLGVLGQFDLVTCLDDAVNYLLTAQELDGFFSGVARNLDESGLAVFDVNSLKLYRTDFGRDWMIDDPGAFIAWTAPDASDLTAGGRVAATIHVFSPAGSRWVRSESHHEQRHWPREEIESAAEAASLAVAAVYGQRRGARVEDRFSELDHDKGLYVITHKERG